MKMFQKNKKLYKTIQENGLNVLVETEGSKARTEKARFLVNTIISVISAIAAIVAAIFAALPYVDP